jgi:hypothetical protein
MLTSETAFTELFGLQGWGETNEVIDFIRVKKRTIKAPYSRLIQRHRAIGLNLRVVQSPFAKVL